MVLYVKEVTVLKLILVLISIALLVVDVKKVNVYQNIQHVTKIQIVKMVNHAQVTNAWTNVV